MNPALHSLAIAAAWAGGLQLIVWVLTIPLRRLSVGYGLASIVLAGTIASVAAIVGTFRSVLSTDQMLLTVCVAMLAGIVASIAAALSAREMIRDRELLMDAVVEIEHGKIPSIGRGELSAELESVREQLEETGRKLNESRARERAAEASRRELVVFLSHDLRTPLAGLRAMAEALEDGLADSNEDYYRQIRVEVDRLSSMVGDLFDISRIQAGSFALNAESVALEDVVSDCVAAMTPLAASKDVRLSGRSTGGATIHGDGQELSRAVSNLVVNAIRHTRAGGSIDVSVGTESGQARVTVRDECGGIPEADLSRVFEIGFRGESARTPEQKSQVRAGFGLAITRGIVDAHRGTIDVHNLDRGCCFTMSLPTAV